MALDRYEWLGRLAAKVPNLTEDAFKKLVPLIVTDVPPWIGPDVGLMLVTLGPVV